MIKWHLEKRLIKDLKDHPKNARYLDKDASIHLQISLETFGLIDKPIINLDNQIIGGHQRKNILKKMGIKEVECYVPDRLLTEREVDELNIRLNKNQGDWDFETLANQWEVNDLLDWGFDLEDFEIPDVEEGLTESAEEEEEECCPTCGQKMKAKKDKKDG